MAMKIVFWVLLGLLALYQIPVSAVAPDGYKLQGQRRAFGDKRSSSEALQLGKNFAETGNVGQCNVSCPNERVADRFRSIDGTCNNLQHRDWGSALVPLRRIIAPAYGDGISTPRLSGAPGDSPLPPARDVSNSIHRTTLTQPEEGTATHMLMQWGQFLDHDITLTPVQEIQNSDLTTSEIVCCIDDWTIESPNPMSLFTNLSVCYPITILPNDPYFTSRTCLNFIRSIQVANARCESSTSPVEQLNQITAYIDGSNVYGSDQSKVASLRQPNSPYLLEELNELLPSDADNTGCVIEDGNHCFLAGDVRVNVQSGLSSMHTIWMREHNRIAKVLKEVVNPSWDDEMIFQETRKIVGAMMQQITYNEFLPVVLGGVADDLKPEPSGGNFRDVYDSDIDASIYNAFATAAYRFGHSLIKGVFKRYNADYYSDTQDHLSNLFGRTNYLQKNSELLGMWMRGLLAQKANKMDPFLSLEVLDKLFEGDAQSGLDLAALNIQRGRDHGLPGYMQWREACQLSTANSFAAMDDIDENNKLTLELLYNSPADIDLFTAGLVEHARAGEGIVGPTFSCILHKQFGALQHGDRFWFERGPPQGFRPGEIEQIRRVSLARLICDHTDTVGIQRNVFMTKVSQGGPVACESIPHMDLSMWNESGGGNGNAGGGSGQGNGQGNGQG